MPVRRNKGLQKKPAIKQTAKTTTHKNAKWILSSVIMVHPPRKFLFLYFQYSIFLPDSMIGETGILRANVVK